MFDIVIEEIPKYKKINEKPKISLYDALNKSYNFNPDVNPFKNHGFKMDKLLSDHEVQVFHRPERKKLLITTKGTNPLNYKDIITDGLLLTGARSRRYTKTQKVLEEAKKKHGYKRAVLVGHSLGHSVNAEAAGKHDKVIGYNGAPYVSTKSKHVKHIAVKGDPVSLLSKVDHIVDGKSHFNKHTIEHIKNKKKFQDLFKLEL